MYTETLRWLSWHVSRTYSIHLIIMLMKPTSFTVTLFSGWMNDTSLTERQIPVFRHLPLCQRTSSSLMNCTCELLHGYDSTSFIYVNGFFTHIFLKDTSVIMLLLPVGRHCLQSNIRVHLGQCCRTFHRIQSRKLSHEGWFSYRKWMNSHVKYQ